MMESGCTVAQRMAPSRSGTCGEQLLTFPSLRPGWLNSHLWEPQRASGSQRKFDAGSAVNSVALHPNQAELISAQQNGTVRVWDLTAGSCRTETNPEGENALRSVCYAPNGTLAVAANNKGAVFTWSADSSTAEMQLIQKFQAHTAYLLKVTFSPNSK
jgi:target of rapamycin complex subunit LST8